MSTNALQPTDFPNPAASLHDAMGRLLAPSFFAPFEALMSRGGPVLAVDIDESDNAYTLRASLPGVKPENAQIEVSGSTVMIRGEIAEESPKNQKDQSGKPNQMVVHERYHGTFQRMITLPMPIDSSKAEATFKDGVMTLVLPKQQRTTAQRIPIKVTG
jgi:HSP20 family protein